MPHLKPARVRFAPSPPFKVFVNQNPEGLLTATFRVSFVERFGTRSVLYSLGIISQNSR